MRALDKLNVIKCSGLLQISTGDIICRTHLLTLMYYCICYCNSANYLLYILHNSCEKL